MRKLNLFSSVQDIAWIMSEGNPGALSVVIEMIKSENDESLLALLASR